MATAVFDPTQPFEAVAETPTSPRFDPSQPFEAVAESPATPRFDPTKPFEVPTPRIEPPADLSHIRDASDPILIGPGLKEIATYHDPREALRPDTTNLAGRTLRVLGQKLEPITPKTTAFPFLNAPDLAAGDFAHMLGDYDPATGEVSNSQFPPNSPAPTWAKVVTGAERGVAQVAGAAMPWVIAGPMIGGATRLPIVARTVSAVFAADMIRQLPDQAKVFLDAVDKGDTQTAVQAAVGGTAGALLSTLALHHAVAPTRVPRLDALGNPIIDPTTGEPAFDYRGIAEESPAIRALLTKKISTEYTPEQIKDVYGRVNRGEANPDEQELVRFINSALEQPGQAARKGVQITERMPLFENEFWRNYLGLKEGERTVTIAGEKPAQPGGPDAVNPVSESGGVQSEPARTLQIRQAEQQAKPGDRVPSPAGQPPERPNAPAQAAQTPIVPSVEPRATAAAEQTLNPTREPAPPPPVTPKPETPKSSTQLTVPEPEAAPFKSFAQSIPDAEVYHKADVTGKEDYGIETQPHVTVLFGLTQHDPSTVAPIISTKQPITVTLGKLSVFSSKDYDVLKVDVHGDDLRALNKEIAKLPNEQTHPEYTPHLTIAYLKKGEGKKYVGDKRFNGMKLTFPSVTFSPPSEIRAKTGVAEIPFSQPKPKEVIPVERQKEKEGQGNVLVPPAVAGGKTPVAPPAIRKGEVGGMLSAGEVVLTSSGRQTTPFPKLKTDTNRKATSTVKRVDAWLRDNAIAEARSRNDEFNARQFEAEDPAKMPPASKSAMEEYLFGQQPEVPAPLLKPITPTPAEMSPIGDKPAAPSEPLDTLGNPESFYAVKSLMGAQMRRSPKLAEAMKFYAAKTIKRLNELATRRFAEMRERATAKTPAPSPATDTPLVLWGRKSGGPWVKLSDNTSNAEMARRQKDGWEVLRYPKGESPEIEAVAPVAEPEPKPAAPPPPPNKPTEAPPVAPVEKKKPATTQAKDPWQMTRKEFEPLRQKVVTVPARIENGSHVAEHNETIGERDPRDKRKIGDTGYFYRSGNLPSSGFSRDYRENKTLEGVSVYNVPRPTSFAGFVENDWYYGKGKIVGFGSDGEPLIKPMGQWRKFADSSPNHYDLVDKAHRAHIEDALRQGKTVPPEVLADYPDLKNPALKSKSSLGPAAAQPMTQSAVESVVREFFGGEIPANVRFVNDPNAPRGLVEMTPGARAQITLNLAKLDSPELVRDTLREELIHAVWDSPAVADARRTIEGLISDVDRERQAEEGYNPNETAEEAANERARRINEDAEKANIFVRAWRAIVEAIKKLFVVKLNADETARAAARTIMREAMRNEPTARGGRAQGAGALYQFFSRLTRTVELSQQGKASGAQWKAMIRNSKLGANMDEMALVGVNDLEDGKTYTKQEVLEYLKANEVVVKDVTLGGESNKFGTPDEQAAAINRLEAARTRFANATGQNDPDFEPAGREYDAAYQAMRDVVPGYGREKTDTTTYFSTYQLPGAKEGSYREVLLTIPENNPRREALRALQDEFRSKYGASWSGQDLNSAESERWRQASINSDAIIGWKDGHSQYSDIPNPIVRLRYNERTTSDGKRMLFLEEVQAPQKGEFEKMPALFQKNWREIAFKWALRHAAENGFDSVGWTTGEQQAARYDLSKQADAIKIMVRRDGDFNIAIKTPGRSDYQTVALSVKPDELENHIGKDLAQKVLSGPKSPEFVYEGKDLSVGGIGLKKLYDSDFRNVVNNLPAVKKAGQKVGTEAINAAEESQTGVDHRVVEFGDEWRVQTRAPGESWKSQIQTYPTEDSAWASVKQRTAVHALAITPEIRNSVMAGQAMFSLGAEPLNPTASEKAVLNSEAFKRNLSLADELGNIVPEEGETGVPTKVGNVEDMVLTRPGLNAAVREDSVDNAAAALREAGLRIVRSDDGLWDLADRVTPQEMAGNALVPILEREIQSARAGNRPERIANLLNTVVVHLARDGNQAFSQTVKDQLYALAQSERSAFGRALGGLAMWGNVMANIAQSPALHLHRIYSKAVGGPEIERVLTKLLTVFRDFFSPEEILRALNPLNLDETAARLVQLKDRDTGGRVYRQVQGRLRATPPKTTEQKNRRAVEDDAIESLIRQAADLGHIEPPKPKNQKLTADEQLALLSNPKVAAQVQAATETAVQNAEFNAGWRAEANAARGDDEALADIAERKALGEDPSPEMIEAGLNLPEFAHWLDIRDNFLDYSPTTLKVVQDVIKGRFKGAKFGVTEPKPEELRIDFKNLATEPDAEVQRVFDAQVAAVQGLMAKATPATVARISEVFRRNIEEQLARHRKETVDKLFKEQATGKESPTAIETLKQKINAGLLRDQRLSDAEMAQRAADKSTLRDVLPSVSEMVERIVTSPRYKMEDIKTDVAAALVKELGLTDEAAANLSDLVYRALDGTDANPGPLREAARKALEQVQTALSPADRKILFKKHVMEVNDIRGRKPGRTLWELIERGARAGLFDPTPVLETMARAIGFKVPTAEEKARMKSWAEEEIRLRTPTQRQIDAQQGTLEEKLAKATRAAEAGTESDRLDLIRKIQATWSRWSMPIGLRNFLDPTIARNNAKAINEFVAANLLAKAGFFFRQGLDVGVVSMPLNAANRSLAHVLERAENDGGFSDATVKDLDAAAKEMVTARLASFKATLVAAARTATGHTNRKVLDRMNHSVGVFERMRVKADELEAQGNLAGARAMRVATILQIGYRVAMTWDTVQSVGLEWQEMRQQLSTDLRRAGKTHAEIATSLDDVFGSIKLDMAEAVAEANAIAAEKGLTKTRSAIQADAWGLIRAKAYDRMRTAAGTTTDYEAENEQYKELHSWNLPETGGVGGVIAETIKGIKKATEKAGIPTGGLFSFGNAMGIAANRMLTFSGGGLFGGFGFGSSEWYKGERNKKQRRLEAMEGLAAIALVIALVAAGKLIIQTKYPKDKDEKEKFIADGHKLNTLRWVNEDGSWLEYPIQMAPFGFIASPLYMVGGVQRLLTDQASAQAKLDAEAASTGKIAGKAKAVDAGDVMGVLAQGVYGMLTGGRTASGAVQSFTDYGDFKLNKAVSGLASPYIPGLPAWQEAARAMGATMDTRTASVLELLVPTPWGGHQRVNSLGDPLVNPNAVSRLVQVMSGGIGWGDGSLPDSLPYRNIVQAGYSTPEINPNKGYDFNGTIRPMTGKELEAYAVARGEAFKQELSGVSVEGLPENEARKVVQAAYARANRTALASVGVSVPATASASGTGVGASGTQTLAGAPVAARVLGVPRGTSRFGPARGNSTLRFARSPSKGLRLPSRRGSLRLGFRKGPTVRRRGTLRLPARSGLLRLRRPSPRLA